MEEFGDEELDAMLAAIGPPGVYSEAKNLIFAANGPKPRIVLRDAINHVIEIIENAEYCLVHDHPARRDGLRCGKTSFSWWAAGGARRRSDPAWANPDLDSPG